MKVINLYGGPGVGKSTTAADIFVHLKRKGYNVELIPEYAKQMVYDKRYNILERDQLYILAKQHRNLLRLLDQPMDFAVVDSPLILTTAYNNHNNLDQDILNSLVRHLDSKYDNLNIFIMRNTNFTYNPNGRTQKNLEDAMIEDSKIKSQIETIGVPFVSIHNDDFITSSILSLIL